MLLFHRATCMPCAYARRGRLDRAACMPAHRDRLDCAARLPRLSPPSRRACTTDAPASRWGEELHVTSSRWWAPYNATNLHVGVKLRNDEPPFVQVTRWHWAKSVRCKCMFQVFQSSDVSEVCCTCCVGYTHLLQMYIRNVSSIFQTYICKCFIWILYMFHRYVASVFIWMLHQWLFKYFQVFLQVF
jgi:hypothetical protein